MLANLGLLISAAGTVILPLLCGQFIDKIKEGESLTEDSIKFIILTLIMAFFSAIRGFGFNLLGELIVRDLRQELFTKLV